MASTHEYIEYIAGDFEGLLDTAVATGTIISVDHNADTAVVDIAGIGVVSGVPIFYHCAGKEEVEGGAVAFLEGDSVYVLNKDGDLTITGFVDGLKSCSWKFKLFRDDDTTIRDGAGNITTPSGLPIDIYNLEAIQLWGLYDGSIDFYSALPGNHGWSSSYWVYNEGTGIWHYDDTDPDYPEWAWRGTYNPSTGYFTVEQVNPSDDKLYWPFFKCVSPTSATDPAGNAAVTTSIIDNNIGIIIKLTAAGNSQTLQTPTDIIAGRTFTVKAKECNMSYVITVNGIVLGAGESQGFTWNGMAWETSTVRLMYALDSQYPYIYKYAEKTQLSDRISVGNCQDNIPYWEELDQEYSPSIGAGSPSGCVLPSDPCYSVPDLGDLTLYFKTGTVIKRRLLKASIPYYIQYYRSHLVHYYAFKGIGDDGLCDSLNRCDGGDGRKKASLISQDELLNETVYSISSGVGPESHLVESDFINPTFPLEYDERSIEIKLSDLSGWCYTDDEGGGFISTGIDYFMVRIDGIAGGDDPNVWTFYSIYFNYE